MANRRIELGWLRVFDEVVRSGSFSAAAVSLGMTQPAVSYQIRQAEQQFGFELLRRRHRGVEVTAAGRRVHEIVRPAVAGIDELARATNAARPAVRLRTDYAFAAFWLLPRMHAFRQEFPDIDIQIVATQRFQPGEMEDDDVAVVFGAAAEFGLSSIILPEEVVPVCSPGFFERHGPFRSPSDLLSARLIHLDAVEPSPWFNWTDYFAQHGLSRSPVASQGDISFNTFSLVVQATGEEQGIALGWNGLIDGMLRTRALIAVGTPLRAQGRGYLLIKPTKTNGHNGNLADWLSRSASPQQVVPAR